MTLSISELQKLQNHKISGSYQNLLPVIQSLISHGANIESKAKDGFTLLHYASQKGHFQIVEYLISHGANIESKTNDGFTPLHIAS